MFPLIRKPWHVFIPSPDGCSDSSNKHCLVLRLIANVMFHRPPQFKSHHFILLIERTFLLWCVHHLKQSCFCSLAVFLQPHFPQNKKMKNTDSACIWSSLFGGPDFTERCITASICIHKWGRYTDILVVLLCSDFLWWVCDRWHRTSLMAERWNPRGVQT